MVGGEDDFVGGFHQRRYHGGWGWFSYGELQIAVQRGRLDVRGFRLDHQTCLPEQQRCRRPYLHVQWNRGQWQTWSARDWAGAHHGYFVSLDCERRPDHRPLMDRADVAAEG